MKRNYSNVPNDVATRSHLRRLLRAAARAVIFTIAMAICTEILSRFVFSVGPIFRTIKGDDSSYCRLQWVQRHTATKHFVYEFDAYDPTRGWALRPSIKNMEVFDGKRLNSNSKGIRGLNEYPYDRQPGLKRIVVLGDSYTFGDEVSDDETYSHALECLLPDTEALNLGIHGYGHDQMLLYLKEEGIKYKPDVVIMGFVWFDMYRNLVTFNAYAKPKFELRDDGLRLTNGLIPPPQTILEQEFYRSKALDMGIILFEKIRWTLGINRTRAEKMTAAIFDEIVKTIHEAGAIPLFVYLPVLDEISNFDQTMTENERFLVSYCTGHQVPCLLLRERFMTAQCEGITFNMRSHWFANGHRTAAQGIAEYLTTNGLLIR